SAAAPRSSRGESVGRLTEWHPDLPRLHLTPYSRGCQHNPPPKGSPAMTVHTAPVALATALAVPNPDALDDMQPHLAWAALHGIARVHARARSTAADGHPAAADGRADMQPHRGWAARHGIARVHARRWSTAAGEHPAAAVVAQACDALAGACEDEEVAALKTALGIDEPPAEDMDYRLSSIRSP